jgi:uncharacterized lipoprotein YmbA
MYLKLLYAMLAAVLLAGCSSKSEFYQLHTPTPEKSNSTKHMQKQVIGVAEVEVAEYLDQPQIVTRISAGRLNVHEGRRWAGSLPKNIQTVLTHELSVLLPRYTFLAYPWEEPVSDRYRIYLSVDRFDGDETGMVTFAGRWSLVDKEENRVITSQTVTYHEKGGVMMDELVATQSRILERLSRQIAKKIRRSL